VKTPVLFPFNLFCLCRCVRRWEVTLLGQVRDGEGRTERSQDAGSVNGSAIHVTEDADREVCPGPAAWCWRGKRCLPTTVEFNLAPWSGCGGAEAGEALKERSTRSSSSRVPLPAAYAASWELLCLWLKLVKLGAGPGSRGRGPRGGGAAFCC